MPVHLSHYHNSPVTAHSGSLEVYTSAHTDIYVELYREMCETYQTYTLWPEMHIPYVS